MTKISRVRRLRFELQLKQHELAKLMGCERSLIAKIETGAAPLTVDKAAKLNEIAREHLGNVDNGQAA